MKSYTIWWFVTVLRKLRTLKIVEFTKRLLHFSRSFNIWRRRWTNWMMAILDGITTSYFIASSSFLSNPLMTPPLWVAGGKWSLWHLQRRMHKKENVKKSVFIFLDLLFFAKNKSRFLFELKNTQAYLLTKQAMIAIAKKIKCKAFTKLFLLVWFSKCKNCFK